MLKILVFLLLLAAVWFIFFRKPAPDSTPTKKESSRRPKGNEEIMVPCATCGVYVSAKEAYIKDGKYYCSTECRDAK